MIRLQIIADRRSSAGDIADLLTFEERIELVDAGALNRAPHHLTASVDVLLAVNLLPTQLPSVGTPVVLLSADPASLPAGVHAWLPLDSSPQAISAAIIAAAAGLYALTPDQLRVSITPAAEDLPTEKLTARELQVLNLMSDGLGNREIAAHLNISSHTAKFHVAQVLAKLRAGSRTEAVRTGIRRGLVAL